MIKITDHHIDLKNLYELLEKNISGSLLFHYAMVKKNNKPGSPSTEYIDYTADVNIENEMNEIEAELRKKWYLEDVLLIRSLGRKSIGDIISVVAVSSPNSDDAFESCRHGLSLLKKMKTVKKEESHL